MKRLGVVAAFLFVAELTIAAQARVVRYDDDRLSDVSAVDVLVRAVAEQDRCAVSRSLIEQEAADALRAAGIAATVSAVGRSWFYSVVIDLRSSLAGSLCASAVRTELVAEVRGIPEADTMLPEGTFGSLLVGAMPLAGDDAVVIGVPDLHDAAVRQVVTAQVAALAARVRAARQ